MGIHSDNNDKGLTSLSVKELKEWLKNNCSDITSISIDKVEDREIDGEKLSGMSADQLMATFELDEADAATFFQRIKNANDVEEPAQDSAPSSTPPASDKAIPQQMISNSDDGGCCCIDMDTTAAKNSDTGCCCCACESGNCLCIAAKGWFECCNIKFYHPLASVFLYVCLAREKEGYWTRTIAVAIAPLIVLAVLLCLFVELVIWVVIIVVLLILSVLAILCFCVLLVGLSGGRR